VHRHWLAHRFDIPSDIVRSAQALEVPALGSVVIVEALASGLLETQVVVELGQPAVEVVEVGTALGHCLL
jgi:hypothetical protein